MKKTVFLLIFSGILWACNSNTKNSNIGEQPKIDTIKTQVFRADSGWGYDIYINSKLFIHQEYIPAVQGNFHFKSAQDARKTAALVVKKMLQHKGLPAVTVQELDSLGVLYKQVKKFNEKIKQQNEAKMMQFQNHQ